jgi:prolyl-tRNA synthetase
MASEKITPGSENISDWYNPLVIAAELTDYAFNDWELKGVPLRIETGPKDVSKRTVALVRRDIPGKDGHRFVSQGNLKSRGTVLLTLIQSALYEKAVSFRANNTHELETYAEFKEIVIPGCAYTWWCGDSECEQKVKEETKATTRCILLDQPHGVGSCIYCAEPANEKVFFARVY